MSGKSKMKRTRRTRTTVEKHEVVVIRGSRKLKRGFCAECSEPIALVTVEEAVRISGISSRAIYRLIEQGRIHLAETPDGVALICPSTLLRQVLEKQDA